MGDHVSGSPCEDRRDRAVARADLEHEITAGDPRQRYELLCESPIAEEVLGARGPARLSGALNGHGKTTVITPSAYPFSSGAMVRPCPWELVPSTARRLPCVRDQTIACPEVWIRFAMSIPCS